MKRRRTKLNSTMARRQAVRELQESHEELLEEVNKEDTKREEVYREFLKFGFIPLQKKPQNN